jgi:predicted dehydrogenase
MAASPFRFGILGTANIARKNWRGIHETGNSIVAAVASRDLERSRQFIRECQSDVPFPSAPQAFGSYEELLASKAVDAVYIPLPTGLRKEWVLKAARAGKHVVCEKPCAVTVSDLREMLDTSRQHRVQFLDGVMFMHSHRLERMRAVLDDKQSVGQIRRITSAFSFKAPPDFFTSNIRARGEMEPHGCVGDRAALSHRPARHCLVCRLHDS